MPSLTPNEIRVACISKGVHDTRGTNPTILQKLASKMGITKDDLVQNWEIHFPPPRRRGRAPANTTDPPLPAKDIIMAVCLKKELDNSGTIHEMLDLIADHKGIAKDVLIKNWETFFPNLELSTAFTMKICLLVRCVQHLFMWYWGYRATRSALLLSFVAQKDTKDDIDTQFLGIMSCLHGENMMKHLADVEFVQPRKKVTKWIVFLRRIHTTIQSSLTLFLLILYHRVQEEIVHVDTLYAFRQLFAAFGVAVRTFASLTDATNPVGMFAQLAAYMISAAQVFRPHMVEIEQSFFSYITWSNQGRVVKTLMGMLEEWWIWMFVSMWGMYYALCLTDTEQWGRVRDWMPTRDVAPLQVARLGHMGLRQHQVARLGHISRQHLILLCNKNSQSHSWFRRALPALLLLLLLLGVWGILFVPSQQAQGNCEQMAVAEYKPFVGCSTLLEKNHPKAWEEIKRGRYEATANVTSLKTWKGDRNECLRLAHVVGTQEFVDSDNSARRSVFKQNDIKFLTEMMFGYFETICENGRRK